MAHSKRRIDREDLERWRDAWSTRDREMVLAALDAVPNPTCLAAPGNGHVDIYAEGRTSGTRSAVINPGYIQWPGRDAHDLPAAAFPAVRENGGWGAWQPLSTFKPNEAGPASPERPVSTCPTCFLALPASGRCDTCD